MHKPFGLPYPSLYIAFAKGLRIFGAFLVIVSLTINPWFLTRFILPSHHINLSSLPLLASLELLIAASGLFLLRQSHTPSLWVFICTTTKRRAFLSGLILTVLFFCVGLILTEKIAVLIVGHRNARQSNKLSFVFTDLSNNRPLAKLWEPDSGLGYRIIPNLQATGAIFKGDKLVTFNRITTNQYGRRINPKANSRGAQYLAFLGCSFTFGDYVNDEDTLPAATERLSDDTQAYNFGVSGYAPQQVWYQLAHENLPKEIVQQKGAVVFTLIDDHLSRTLGTVGYVLGYGEAAPTLRWKSNGTIELAPKFSVEHPQLWQVYRYLGGLSLIDLFPKDFPLKHSVWEQHQMVEVLKAQSDLVKEKWGTDRYYVLLFPNTNPNYAPMLRERGIRVLDYSRLFPLDNRFLLADRHPNARAYRAVAERIVQDLEIK